MNNTLYNITGSDFGDKNLLNSFVSSVPNLNDIKVGVIGAMNNGKVNANGDLFQPGLFEDSSFVFEDKQGLQNIEIKNLRSILAFIYNTFHSKANCLNCFFTIGNDDNKFCFHYLNSLPIIRFSIFETNSSSAIFSSDWNGSPNVYDGWDIIPSNEMQMMEILKKPNSYKAKSSFLIKNIKNINVYNWGFEIFSDSGLELNCVLEYALIKDPERIIGKVPYRTPFDPNILAKPDFMKKIAVWISDS